ncbi:MAG: putative transporter ATP-binding protein [Bacteroidetes bacterium]|nr:putative transporter ATP-binding protein [Bacteroidota bacterium]
MIANAGKIVVLNKGPVAESGSPEELKKKGGLFTRIIDRQMLHINE